MFCMKKHAFIVIFLMSFAFGCSAPPDPDSSISVQVFADNQEYKVSLPQGGNVEQALEIAELSVNNQDRLEPSFSSILNDGDVVKLIRVTEEYTSEQEIVPFEQQVLQTESLPENTTLIAQKGENGIKEFHYRHVIEDGKEVSKTRLNDETIIKEPIPEIIMVGIQTPFTTYSIPGRLAYLLGGNAWLMDGSSGNRRPIVTTGDLDGRIFSLSPDGNWLLFSRRMEDIDTINTLWVVKIGIDADTDKLIDLKVNNVVHYAEWVPGSSNLEVAFSTVEPRSTAPGWQANNDFNVLSFSSSGWISKWKTYLDSNSGGVYGWWGTNFAWSKASETPTFARPDSIGSVNLKDGTQTSVLDIIPYQTHGDWAWIPGFTLSPDQNNIYYVAHAPQSGDASEEESQVFDLQVFSLQQQMPIRLVSQTGMFAYPVASAFLKGETSNDLYQVAFLQAIFPTQSETSRYRLSVIDQDGSNVRALFPSEEKIGLEPQRVLWSPTPMPDTESYAIATIYNGNLYIVDIQGELNDQSFYRQITGDGLVIKISWVTY
jgi:hypothetical protein